MSSLVFSWKCAKNVYVTSHIDGNKLTYVIHGQIFFASISNFKSLFEANEEQQDITIDFKHSRVWDYSALEAIEFIAQKYLRNNKALHLVHLSPNCSGLLDKIDNSIIANPAEDLDYRMAVLQRDKF